MQPKVLIAATSCWVFPSRLAISLSEAGCLVEAVCPSKHSLRELRSVGKTYRYHALAADSSLLAAIRKSEPDLVVPCDEHAVLALHRIACRLKPRRQRRAGAAQAPPSPAHLSEASALDDDRWLEAVLERSLAPTESYRYLDSRSELLKLAKRAGINAPYSADVRSLDELFLWLKGHGYPAFLKADGTYGGEGVLRIRDYEEARTAYETLCCPPSTQRILKRSLVDQDLRLLLAYLRRERPQISVHQGITGPDANATMFCWRGEMLAMVGAKVVRTLYDRGPSTMIEITDHPGMRQIGKRLASALQLSGFFGIDFIIEEKTNKPFLIEMNARATQTSHLRFGENRDLSAAAVAALTDQPAQAVRTCPIDTVALFPHGWSKTQSSASWPRFYHDVPWSEPSLVRRCLEDFPDQMQALGLADYSRSFNHGSLVEFGHSALADGMIAAASEKSA